MQQLEDKKRNNETVNKINGASTRLDKFKLKIKLN